MSSTASMANSVFLERRSMSAPRRAEAAGAAPARRQRGDLVEGDAADRRDDQLGDALAALQHDRLAAEIAEADLELAAIVGDDRARGVEQSEPVLEAEAGARPERLLIAQGQTDGEAGRHRHALARRE